MLKFFLKYFSAIACAAILVSACNPLDVDTPRDVRIEDPDPGLRPARTLSLMFAIDASASMGPDNDLYNTVEASRTALGLLNGRYDLAGLVWMNRSIGVTDLTDNMSRVSQAMDAIVPQQDTRLWDGAYEAVQRVVNGPERDVGAVVLVADGQDMDSNISRDSLIHYAHKNKIAVYTVGLRDFVDGESLQRIATATEGQYYHNGGDLDSLKVSFNDMVINHMRQTP